MQATSCHSLESLVALDMAPVLLLGLKQLHGVTTTRAMCGSTDQRFSKSGLHYSSHKLSCLFAATEWCFEYAGDVCG